MKFKILLYVMTISGLFSQTQPPNGFEFNISSKQAFYFVSTVWFENEFQIENEDWIGSFRVDVDERLSGECEQSEMNYDETIGLDGSTCIIPVEENCPSVDGDMAISPNACPDLNDDGVLTEHVFMGPTGARQWGECQNSEWCDIPVMGNDNEDYSSSYFPDPNMQNEIPEFRIYDNSESAVYYVTPSENFPYSTNSYFFIDTLSVLIDCSNDLGGSASIDDCGVCCGGNTGLECSFYTDDSNYGGAYDCMGECSADSPIGCSGENCGEAYIDGCGDCVEGSTGIPECENDCTGLLEGTAVWDDCGQCVEGTTGDIYNWAMDCNNDCFGSAIIDDCGVCSNGQTEHSFNIDIDCNGDCAENTPVSCEGENCGEAIVDDCGVCSNGATDHEYNIDIDCNGDCFGSSELDSCGICGGDDSFCNTPTASNQSAETDEDITLTIFPLISDPNDYPLSMQITQNPEHGIILWQPPAFVYTPNENFNGEDSLKYVVSNFTWSSEEATIYIQIDSVNDAPTSDDLSIETSEDTDVEIALLVNDVDSQISISVGDIPHHGFVQLVEETAIYTPDFNYFGTDSFTYIVDDGEYSIESFVEINILSINDIPVSNDISINTNEDTYFIGTASVNDVDNSQDQLSLILQNQSSLGQFTIIGLDFTFYPYTNVSGMEAISFKIFDGTELSEEYFFMINIIPVNDFPEIMQIGDQVINEDSEFSYMLDGFDIDGDELEFSAQVDDNASVLIDGNSLTIVPEQDWYGRISTTVSLSDGEFEDQTSFNLEVNPVNDSPESQNVQIEIDEDTPTSFTISAVDIDSNVDDLSIISITYPIFGDIQFNGLDVEYIPFENMFGNEHITFWIFDGINVSNTYELDINILPINDTPEISGIPNQSINEDNEFIYTIEGDDIDGDTLEYSAQVDGNASVLIDGNLLTIIPDQDWFGLITVYTSVSDESSSSQTEFEIIVNPINDPPEFTTTSLENADEDALYLFQILTHDIDNETEELILNLEQHPSWLSLVGSDLHGTPTNSHIGQDFIVLSAYDGELITTSQFSIFVNETNDIPNALDITSQLNEDDSIDLILFGTDEESLGDLTFEIVDNPLNGQLSFNNRDLATVTYTPNENYFGTDSFSYIVSDGENPSDLALAELSINSVNDSPYFLTTNDDIPLLIEDIQETIQIEFIDIDNDQDELTLEIVFAPSWVILDGDNLIVNPINTGITNTFTDISLSLNDGEKETIQTFTLEVEPVNDAPISLNISTFVTEDESVSVTLLGVDEDSELLSFEINSTPLHGIVDILDDEVIYMPNLNNNIPDSFEYVVFDGEFYSDPSTVLLEVIPVNDPPEVIESVEFEVLSENQYEFDLSSYFSDIDSPEDNLSLTFLPHGNGDNIVGMTFGSGNIENVINEDFTYIYNRTPLSLDTDYILFKISDGMSESSLGLIAFVLNANRDENSRGIIQSVPQNIDVSEDIPLEISLVAYNSNPLDIDQNFPTDGNGITYEIINNPTHGDLSDFVIELNDENDGYVVFSGSYYSHPDFGDDIGIDDVLRDEVFCDESGLDSLSYSIFNPITTTWTDTVTIEFCVHGVNDPPTILNAIDKTVDEDNTLAIPLEVNSGFSSGDIQINPIAISIFDPDTSYNYIDFEFNSIGDYFNFEISSLSDTVYLHPFENYNGISQIQVTVSENYDFNFDEIPDFADTPDPPFEDSQIFSVEVIPVNDPPIVSNISDKVLLEESSITVELASSDIDSEGITTFEINIGDTTLLSSELLNNQLTLQAKENQIGLTNITVTANDGESDSIPVEFQVTVQNVNDIPTLSPISNPSSIFEEGVVEIEINPLDNDALDSLRVIVTSSNSILFPSESIVVSPLIELTNFSRQILLTPAINQFGSSDFTVEIFDDESSTIQQFSVVVEPVNDPPIMSELTPVELNEDSNYELLLDASDVDNTSLQYSVSTNENYDLILENNLLTINPIGNYFGLDTLNVFVEDDSNAQDQTELILTVIPVNDAPVLSQIGDILFAEDTSIEIDLDATDIDSESLSYSISEGENITANIEGSTLTFTALENFSGIEIFTITVSDSELSDSETFQVNVLPTNDIPVATILETSTEEDNAITLSLSGSDIDGNTNFTFAIVSDAEHGSVVLNESMVSYTPNADFNGVDSFEYTVNDGELISEPALVTIQTTPINDAPLLSQIGDITFAEDTSIDIELVATDVDSESLSYSISEGENITANIEGSTLTFTASENFNGTESFDIAVSDGELSDDETINVEVLFVNDAPILPNIEVETNEDISKVIELIGSDDSNIQLTYSIQSQPENGIASINGPLLSYTPNPDYYGSDVVEISANDSELTSEISTVTIEVTPVNDAPVIISTDPIEMSENTVLEIEISAIDIENDNLIFSTSTYSNNITTWFIGNILSVYPSNNWNGVEEINIAVSDGELITSEDIQVTVLAVNDPPTTENQSVEMFEEEEIIIPLEINDVDSYDFEYFLVQFPSHGSIEFNSGFAQYTPDVDYFGQDTIVYYVNDGEYSSNNALISIEIQNINDAPVIPELVGLEVYEDSEFVLDINEFDVDGDELDIEIQINDNATYEVIDGILYVTPILNFYGDISITLSIADVEFSDSQTFTLTILSVNDPPVIVSFAPTSIFTHEEYSYQVVVEDPDDSEFEFELIDAPIGMTVSEIGLVTWTPDITGVFGPITLLAHDGGEDEVDSAQEYFTITVLLSQMLDMHTGANLISYLGILEDNSIDNMFADIEGNVYQILSETTTSIYTEEFGWIGSLTEIEPTKGYWLRMTENELYSVESFSTDLSQIYSLHEGNNLISYISGDGLPLDTALPDDVELHFTDIMTENYSATRDADGNWVGSLASIGWQQLKGYWVKVDEPVIFSYESLDLTRIEDEKPIFNLPPVLDEFRYTHSTKQSFYFIKDIQLDEIEVTNEDWVIASCNNIIVGARQWNGMYTDIPVMGSDGDDSTAGYCSEGDTPVFLLFQHETGELIDLENNNVPEWTNVENQVIPILTEFNTLPEEFSLGKPYPNPFNPVTTISYDIPFDTHISIQVYDVRGRLVETLINHHITGGSYKINWIANNNASGLYFVQMIAGNSVQTQKVMLIK